MKTIRVKDLGQVVTGHTPPTSDKDYYGGDILFIKPTDMVAGQRYTFETEEYFSEKAYNKYKSSLLPKGSTCVVCIGTLGDKLTITHCEAFTNQSVNSIIPNKRFNQDYVYYLMKYNLPKVKNLNSGTASGREFVSKTIFEKLSLDVHEDVKVQQKIASILSAYDFQIENNQKRIKLLEQMAESLYKEWFVRFRFPGYENAEFEGGLPKGWSVEKLNNCIEVCYGKDHKKIEDGDIPIFGSGGIMRYGNKALFDGESVLIPRKGSLNNVMYYNGKAWTVDTMFYTKMLHPYLAKYMFYTMNSLDLASFNSGAALPSMTTDILYHFKIIKPAEKILKMFDEILCPLYDEKDLLAKQNDLLTKQRDLLLPRLMSGKLSI